MRLILCIGLRRDRNESLYSENLSSEYFAIKVIFPKGCHYFSNPGKLKSFKSCLQLND